MKTLPETRDEEIYILARHYLDIIKLSFNTEAYEESGLHWTEVPAAKYRLHELWTFADDSVRFAEWVKGILYPAEEGVQA